MKNEPWLQEQIKIEIVKTKILNFEFPMRKGYCVGYKAGINNDVNVKFNLKYFIERFAGSAHFP